MKAVYSAICLDCDQELTQLDGTLDFNISLAHNHSQSTGHTCQVLKEHKSIFVNRRQIKISSEKSRQLVKTFSS